MKRSKNSAKIAKAKDDKKGDKLFRLTDIEPEFVSLVQAGANRQKTFMVVKEDAEQVVPNAATDNDICAALPIDPKECIQGTDDANKNNDGNEPPGNGSPEKDAVDLASWLDEAGTKVDALALDHAVAAALNTPAEVPAVDVGETSKEAHEIEDAAAPAATEVEKKADEERLSKMHQLEDKLKKAEREIVSLKAKNARLSKDVGKSSVILTGEVTAKGLQNEEDNENTSPSRGAFLSGGDIAAAVAKSGG